MKVKKFRSLKEEWETNLDELKEKCVREYCDFALLKEEADIDPDNLDDYVLSKVSRRNYYDINDLKALLSERGKKRCK